MWSPQDPATLYGSYIDDQNVGDQYTAVTTEAIAGSGATRTGTLAFKAGGAKRTCFNVSFTDGVETFGDNFDGTLTGSAGGTGTINYATGAYAITFNASATTVTSDYFWENATKKQARFLIAAKKYNWCTDNWCQIRCLLITATA
jgi:hypothetical protein